MNENKPERNPESPVLKGATFTERKLYEMFKMQMQGGIRFRRDSNYVILVQSYSSNYKDLVDEKSGTIIFSGTGEGDQEFERGIGRYNERVKAPTSILLYFEKLESNKLIFRYCVKYDSYSYDREKNMNGEPRQVIKFKLNIIR